MSFSFILCHYSILFNVSWYYFTPIIDVPITIDAKFPLIFLTFPPPLPPHFLTHSTRWENQSKTPSLAILALSRTRLAFVRDGIGATVTPSSGEWWELSTVITPHPLLVNSDTGRVEVGVHRSQIYETDLNCCLRGIEQCVCVWWMFGHDSLCGTISLIPVIWISAQYKFLLHMASIAVVVKHARHAHIFCLLRFPRKGWDVCYF